MDVFVMSAGWNGNPSFPRWGEELRPKEKDPTKMFPFCPARVLTDGGHEIPSHGDKKKK